MTLTDRLSASFLGALALVLVGFSTALYIVASVHLHRSVDERLDSALGTLTALVEDEADGLDWERDGRQISTGQDPGTDQVRWMVLDGRGGEIDRSRNMADPDVMREAGERRLGHRGRPWRVVTLRLKSSHPASPDRAAEMVLVTALRLDPIERELRNLALALAGISAGLWGITALVGRRLCRRALAPLTRMASSARELGVDEPGRRLPVASTGDELEELASAFNGLLDRWHEALERQARFAGDASHQLRTPLTALIGQIDVALRRDRPPEEYRRTLTRARDQSDRLRRIVEALLFLARADAEAGLPSLEPFDLISWTSEEIRRRSAEGNPAPIRWEEPLGGPILVRAHPALLAQVLDNLLDNARDHGATDAPAEVRVYREPGGVALSVEDRGRGIDPGDLPRIFEPFYRAADSRRSASGGVGLGLAVARRIARALGATLDAESRPGQGSRFTLRLPEFLPTADRPMPDPMLAGPCDAHLA